MRGIRFRADLRCREIPAPQGLAPDAFALAGDVRPRDEGGTPHSAPAFHPAARPRRAGRLGGAWRIVCFAQAPLEPEIGMDPFLADVAWSWLVDALDARGATYHSASGTATKTLSKGFGSLAAEGDGAQIELRASWSPHGPLAPHVEAWAELVCMLAGLPPGSEGIASRQQKDAA